VCAVVVEDTIINDNYFLRAHSFRSEAHYFMWSFAMQEKKKYFMSHDEENKVED